MRILITGAGGFIGSYITGRIIKDGYEVTCAVKDKDRTKLKFPGIEIAGCDFNTDHDPLLWKERLKDIDIVINAVGILQNTKSNDINNVHIKGTQALFEGAKLANVKKIIHISALGIDDEQLTQYSSTKREADNYLKSLEEIDWVILKPSLIYAVGCYGGTALMRGLSALPVIPLIGDGSQKFQPVHINDLVETVIFFISKNEKTQKIINVVGPEEVPLREILSNFRRWLGLMPTRMISIPKFLVRLACRVGDIIGAQPLNTTSYHMLEHGNTAGVKEFIKETGINPINFKLGLATEPQTIQSLWHARLYFLRPLIRFMLGVFWLLSGVISLFIAPELTHDLLTTLGFKGNYLNLVLVSSCAIDMLLGLCLIFRYKITQIGLIQILLVSAYTIGLTILQPSLWMEPLGVLIKNIPILLITLVMIAIEREK